MTNFILFLYKLTDILVGGFVSSGVCEKSILHDISSNSYKIPME